MAKKEGYHHQSVLLPETLTALAIHADGVYIDATLGRGGHSKEILARLNAQGKLIAFDKDIEAIQITREYLGADKRIEFIHGSFAALAEVAKNKGIVGRVNGILFDLGVSSPQLEDPSRGFSFLQDGPLDMRMDNTQGLTAAKWIATAKESEIMNVLFEYGEERFARRIARAIVQERAIEPIVTTRRLSEIVSKANPAWEKGKHPATRSFQAIRIFINQELNELEVSLQLALEILAVGGRLVVISFHSLEDRIVKQFMRQQSKGAILPKEIPIAAMDVRPRLHCIGRGVKPTAAEIAANPRSRSAVLRIAEKLR